MSKSRRKTPIIGIGGGGKGKYSRYRWSKERNLVREKLSGGDYEGLEFEQYKFDEWATNRDGKNYVSLRGLRKNPYFDYLSDTELEIWYNINILGK